jgi:hypothetical protein
MYSQNTLFVLGAGASAELGFPLGSGLKAEVSSLVSLRTVTENSFQRTQQRYPENNDFYQFAYRQRTPIISEGFASKERDTLNANMDKWTELAQGLPFASSIDNYLHIRRNDPELVRIGKLAIANVIAKYEKRLASATSTDLGARAVQSWLAPGIDGPASGATAPRPAWTLPFSEQFFSGVEQNQLESAFSRVKFIVFNYDRCLENFLGLALRSIYCMPAHDASSFVARHLSVVHPYGSLGQLLGVGRDVGVEFGACPTAESAGGSIKLYTEGRSTADDKHRIASFIGWADTILFLGNGYHAQNMKLLSHPARQTVRIFATGVGLSETAQREAVSRILRSLKPRDANAFIPLESVQMKSMTCAELFIAEAVQLSE